ncbi:MAG: hypothetical protein ACYCWW_10495 [Deltaproteobacteria bacterium]
MTPPGRVAASRLTYDVIVFGGDLGGAVAAALLTRRGHRVLAVVHGAPPPTYQDQGFVFSTLPSLLPSLRTIPAAVTALEELGLLADVGRAQLRLEPPLQLLTDSSRLELPADPSALAAELARELGDEAGAAAMAFEALASSQRELDPFFSESPPFAEPRLLERWRQRRARGQRPKVGAAAAEVGLGLDGERPLDEALRALWRLGSSLALERPSSAPSLRPLSQLLGGATSYPGGLLGLARELRARVPGMGGEVSDGPSGRVHDIALAGRKLSALRLTGSPHEYRAAMFIAALPGAELRDLLPAAAATSPLAATASAVRPRRALAVMNLVVAEAGVPVGLGRAALLVPTSPPGGDAREGLLIEQLPVERAEGRAGVPSRVLQLSRQAGVERFGSEAAVRELFHEMRSDLERFFPFLGRHVLAESSPLLGAAGGGEGPLALALRLHVGVEVGLRSELGLTGLPIRSPSPNLLFASREVLPGLGLEGEFLAGIAAAAEVERRLPKKARLTAR